jgi:hypothetical protein
MTATKIAVGTITFDGVLLGSSSSQNGGAKLHHYSTLSVWRTEEGRFVLERCQHRGARGLRRDIEVFASRQECQSWLGFGALSLRLYSEVQWPI